MAKKRGNASGENPPAKRPAFPVIRNDTLDRKREIFYNLAADTEFRMADGIIIRFNKGMLYSNTDSDVFYQILFGPLKKEVTTLPDITYSTFKLFLDCVMGFTPYTYDTAFTIFPVAWKYQVEKSINDCTDALVSDEALSKEKICDVLNMGTMYDCKLLIERIVDFISKNHSFHKILEDTSSSFLLEARSLIEILKHVVLDSYAVNVLLEWGQNYLNKKCEGISIRELFDQYRITDFIKIEHFESVNSLFEFYLSDFGRTLFLPDQIKSHLKNSTEIKFTKSEWRKIKKGESLIEEISVNDVKLISVDKKFAFNFRTNYCVFYEPVPSEENKYVTVKLHGNKLANRTEHETMYVKYLDFKKCSFRLKNPVTYFGSLRKVSKNFLKVEYQFHCDCRILLTDKLSRGSTNLLCFTSYISQMRM